MTPQQVNDLIIILRRAPLANMAEAENVARLIDAVANHFMPPTNAPTPATVDRPADPDPTPAPAPATEERPTDEVARSRARRRVKRT